MGTKNIILNAFKKYIAIGLVGITVTDRYAGVCPVRGSSMSPTFNPSLGSLTDDYVFLEKFCLDKYRFSHGDVVIFSSPTSFNETSLKRIVAMEGDYISNVSGAIKVPEGHCWVEGDNSASSVDSRSFGV
ncbi:mitochondrial inner membrane protease subunit 2, partial [Tanacetum coccineum]